MYDRTEPALISRLDRVDSGSTCWPWVVTAGRNVARCRFAREAEATRGDGADPTRHAKAWLRPAAAYLSEQDDVTPQLWRPVPLYSAREGAPLVAHVTQARCNKREVILSAA